MFGSILLGRPNLVGSDESALIRAWTRTSSSGVRGAGAIGLEAGTATAGRSAVDAPVQGNRKRLRVAGPRPWPPRVGNRRARGRGPRAESVSVCCVWFVEMTIHDPRQDRILPQTGDIAKKVPLRAIVFKAWYARWQMADGRWQRASSRRRLTDGKRRIAERNWLLAPRPTLLAVDKKSIGRRQGNPEGLPRRRPDLCLGMDLLAGISVRSPAHHLVQHPVKSEFELFWCFVTSGCDLPANLLHFLVADLRQLADAVEHLSQGGDLDMIARAPACTV